MMNSKKGASLHDRLRTAVKESIMDFSLKTKLPPGYNIDKLAESITVVIEQKVSKEGFLSLKEFENVTWTLKMGLKGDADIVAEAIFAL